MIFLRIQLQSKIKTTEIFNLLDNTEQRDFSIFFETKS